VILPLPVYTSAAYLRFKGRWMILLAGQVPESGTQNIRRRPPHGQIAKNKMTQLDDDLFLVESLLGKRVRRIRRRKVVQYLVKWKGYPEEENTWADEADIHEDLIRDYESRSLST
jgi:hypothetical protein